MKGKGETEGGQNWARKFLLAFQGETYKFPVIKRNIYSDIKNVHQAVAHFL
jgi:hypothetical protein